MHRWIGLLDRAVRFLEAIAAGVASLCVLGLIVFTAADVVGRYAFGRAQGWVHDAALVLMIGLCFLSLAPLQRRMGNVAVQVFFFRLPPAPRRVVLCLQLGIGIAAAGVLGWRNTLYALEAWRMGWIYSGFGLIPTALPYGFIGGGCLLLALRLAVQLLQAASSDLASEPMLRDQSLQDVAP
jgi:TRAP-type C4-dicarboxylate transport system permease small subunit